MSWEERGKLNRTQPGWQSAPQPSLPRTERFRSSLSLGRPRHCDPSRNEQSHLPYQTVFFPSLRSDDNASVWMEVGPCFYSERYFSGSQYSLE